MSRLVGTLKGISARQLSREFPRHIHTCAWGAHFRSPSNLAASRGEAPPSIITASSSRNNRT
ncbi:hypothetical protein ACWF95_41560 [Streptomyces vinaceus]